MDWIDKFMALLLSHGLTIILNIGELDMIFVCFSHQGITSIKFERLLGKVQALTLAKECYAMR